MDCNNGAELVAFGESFIPGFPILASVLRPVNQHRFYIELYHNAMEIGDKHFKKLQEIASTHHVYLSLGITEKDSNSPGTMWNTNLLLGPNVELLNRHR